MQKYIEDCKDHTSFILGVDIGTTNIKCYAYDNFSNIVGKAEDKVDLQFIKNGGVEIHPDNLWLSFVNVIKNCLKNSKLNPENVSSLGISTQRGTFLVWDEDTGQPYHNFITWKDTRAENYCLRWNSSFSIKLFRFGALLLYLLTRKNWYQVASSLKFTSAMVLMRLLWLLDSVPEVRERCRSRGTLFGTIDTWLVWKLTGGAVHATDGSNACVTGLFDPLKMQWAKWTFKMFNIPPITLPTVKNTSDCYGSTLESIFGSSISINAVVGDQQASMFGACCFEYGDINCTMGTGSFLNINTGTLPSVSYGGVYPLIGWTINFETTYVAECGVHDSGTIITWAQKLGLFDQPSISSNIAHSVSDSGGVYFLPPSSVLQGCPQNSRSSAFIGLKVHTTKEEMVRSVLEALVFQVCMMYDSLLQKNFSTKKQLFRICGGVSKNDFIVQLISDITLRSIQRLKHTETSSLGAAFLAGLHSGVWKDIKEISSLHRKTENFHPNKVSKQQYHTVMHNWSKVLFHSITLEAD